MMNVDEILKWWKNNIFTLMRYFPDSFINAYGELIICKKGNVFFDLITCNTREDMICKLLEWCSRPLAKGEPFRNDKRNKEWRDALILGLNEYLGTHFTQDDMYWIYDKLGNGVDHNLTLKFIRSSFDLSLLCPKLKNEAEKDEQ